MSDGQTTFSPGDIDAFAKFVSEEVATEIRQLTTKTQDILEVDFGEYDLSPEASNRYARATTEHIQFLSHLGERVDQLVSGTRTLAQRYADLEELNASGSTTVISALNHPA